MSPFAPASDKFFPNSVACFDLNLASEEASLRASVTSDIEINKLINT